MNRCGTKIGATSSAATLRCTQIVPAGSWEIDTACDRIALDYDARHRRRFHYVADGGTDFLLDLPRATLIHDGDGLKLDDGRIVHVIAAAESLVEVTAANAHALLRLAWHIGNRHLPAQLCDARILIRDDHVIVAMLHGLGACTRTVSMPFTPESGAYAGTHVHSHGSLLSSATSFVPVDGHDCRPA